MTAHLSVRKPALDAPEPIELEFVRDRSRSIAFAAPGSPYHSNNTLIGSRRSNIRAAACHAVFRCWWLSVSSPRA